MYQRMGCKEIYAYWDELRGNEAAPRRSQIEPVALRTVLPDIFMLETHNEEDLIFRLVGTRMCARFGRELRGYSFDMLWAGGRRSNAVEIAQAAILYESPVILNLVGFLDESETRRFEMLLMPVRSSDGHSDRLLGALIPLQGEEHIHSPWALKCLFVDRSRPLSGHADQAFPTPVRQFRKSIDTNKPTQRLQ